MGCGHDMYVRISFWLPDKASLVSPTTKTTYLPFLSALTCGQAFENTPGSIHSSSHIFTKQVGVIHQQCFETLARTLSGHVICFWKRQACFIPEFSVLQSKTIPIWEPDGTRHKHQACIMKSETLQDHATSIKNDQWAINWRLWCFVNIWRLRNDTLGGST